MVELRMTLDAAGLSAYVAGQLNAFFPDRRVIAPAALQEIFPRIRVRLEHCFSRISNKYFSDQHGPRFDHLHGDQYAMFLYLAANTAWRERADLALAAKLYLLNKALHGVDAFYEVELPSIFMFVHPLGTVLGRASYADYLLVYQRCGVGSNHDVYPTLGEYLTLRPGAAVLGRSCIGRNCTIAAESLLLDRDLPANTVYLGNPRDFITRLAKPTQTVWHKS